MSLTGTPTASEKRPYLLLPILLDPTSQALDVFLLSVYRPIEGDALLCFGNNLCLKSSPGPELVFLLDLQRLDVPNGLGVLVDTAIYRAVSFLIRLLQTARLT